MKKAPDPEKAAKVIYCYFLLVSLFSSCRRSKIKKINEPQKQRKKRNRRKLRTGPVQLWLISLEKPNPPFGIRPPKTQIPLLIL